MQAPTWIAEPPYSAPWRAITSQSTQQVFIQRIDSDSLDIILLVRDVDVFTFD